MAGLDDIPAGAPATAPPPGTAPNYADPVSMDSPFVVLGIFLSLSILAVSIRLFVRFRFTKTWGWDDYTCILAAIGSVIYAALFIEVTTRDPIKHIWDTPVASLSGTVKYQSLWVNGVGYQITIFFTKLSILFLYIRIFNVNETFSRIAAISVAVLILIYLPLASLAIAFLAACKDLTSLTENPFCQGYGVPSLIFSAVFNTVTDFWLLLMPFPLLMKLKLQPRQKLGLAAVFATGIGACAASIARLIEIVIHLDSSDPTWSQSIVAEFSIVEINIGIVVACVSSFPVFFSRVQDWLRHTRRNSKHTRIPGSEPEASQIA